MQYHRHQQTIIASSGIVVTTKKTYVAVSFRCCDVAAYIWYCFDFSFMTLFFLFHLLMLISISKCHTCHSFVMIVVWLFLLYWDYLKAFFTKSLFSCDQQSFSYIHTREGYSQCLFSIVLSKDQVFFSFSRWLDGEVSRTDRTEIYVQDMPTNPINCWSFLAFVFQPTRQLMFSTKRAF